MMAELLPFAKAELTIPTAASVAEALSCLNRYYEHQYTFEFGTSVDAADVVVEANTHIFALPDLAFLKERKVVSHAELVPLLDYVAILMDLGTRPAAKPRAAGALKVDRALAAEFPWLTNYLSDGREHSSVGPSGGSKPPETKILGLGDDATQEAFDELQAKRAGRVGSDIRCSNAALQRDLVGRRLDEAV